MEYFEWPINHLWSLSVGPKNRPIKNPLKFDNEGIAEFVSKLVNYMLGTSLIPKYKSS